MLSRTQVTNNGLRVIGANLVADPNEDTESARQTAAVYDHVVRRELEGNAWYFAKTQAALPALQVPPLYKFAFAYNLPATFIRLVELEARWVFTSLRHIDIDPVPAYEMQGRTLATDLRAPLKITYLQDLSEDPTLWPPTFATVVSMSLAMEVAFTLSKSGELQDRAQNAYKNAVLQAKRTNAIQMPPQQMPDSSWMTARLY